jgi:hypothetical protein
MMAAAFLLLSVMQVSAQTCTVGNPLSGGTEHCSSNASGSISGGYSWTIWSSGTGGCINTYGVGAAFKATWNNSGDFLARAGLGWNSSQTYTQIGNIYSDFAYTKTGSAGGWSYIGIYGWSENPLHEYYIVEDWFGSGGPPTGGGTKMGTFTVDGGTYNVYQHTQTNQPSIQGTATFVQFFSIRQTPRQCGHISISEHFKEWASLGLTLGNMEEAKVLVEAGGGSGSIDFTKATVVVGPYSSVSRLPEPEPSPGRNTFLENSKGSGVLSLVSLNGTVIQSVRQNGPEQAIVPTDHLAKGVYLLQFQGDGKALVTRVLLIK